LNIYLQVFKERKWLGNISYQTGLFEFYQKIPTEELVEVPALEDVLKKADSISSNALKSALKLHISDQTLIFSGVENLRWFVLPSEAKFYLMNSESTRVGFNPPFYPKTYSKSEALRASFGSYSGKNVILTLEDVKNVRPFKIRDFLQSDKLNGADRTKPMENEVQCLNFLNFFPSLKDVFLF
jgi:hypothetical protein